MSRGEYMVNPSTISDIQAEIHRLQEQKLRIDNDIQALETTLQYFEGLERIQHSGPKQSSGAGPDPSQIHSSEHDARDAIFEILSKERPLHRNEILSRLSDMGIHTGGRSPVANLSSRLSHDHRFRSLGGGVWDLVDGEAVPSSSSESLRDVIHEILSDEHPLHRREVHARLAERGVRVAGQDPVNNVGAHLSLDDRFMSLGGGLWDLVEQPDGSSRIESSNFEVTDGNDELEDEDEDDVPW